MQQAATQHRISSPMAPVYQMSRVQATLCHGIPHHSSHGFTFLRWKLFLQPHWLSVMTKWCVQQHVKLADDTKYVEEWLMFMHMENNIYNQLGMHQSWNSKLCLGISEGAKKGAVVTK